MFDNKFVIILFFLVLIISVGSVNAAEDISIENNGEILTVDANMNGEVINGLDDSSSGSIGVDGNEKGDFQSLEKLIENASENSEINLTQDYTFTFGSDDNITHGIILDKSNITINGNGYSINALGQTRMFQIYGDNVLLKNLNFIGGSTTNMSEDINDSAGGALIWFGANGIISGCTFTNNTALQGGAVYVDNDLTVENSVFLDNKAKMNPISVNDEENQLRIIFSGEENYFNAVYSSSDYLINYANVTYWRAGIVNSDDEYPTKYDGLVDIPFVMEIYDESGILIDNVSGITEYIGYFKYDYDTFDTGNYSYNIYHVEDNYYTAVDEKGNFTIVQPSSLQSLKELIDNASENSVINLTQNYKFIYGLDDNITRGIVINKSNITINGNGHSIDAFHQTRMFLVYGDNIKIYNLTFIQGSTPNDGNISEGDTYWFGGSIIWYGADGCIENCLFTDCKSNADGGAVHWDGDNGKVVNSTFELNFARSEGGGIYWDGVNGSLLNSTFRYNSLEMNNGAGVFWSATGINCYVANCNFEYNTAFTGHGALYCFSHNGVIFNSTFIGNFAGFSGGGILSYANNATIDHCTFIENTAKELPGGGVNWAGQGGKIINSVFIGNHALTKGGGVNVGNDDKIDVGNCMIANCTFTSNIAETYGGGLHWQNDNGTLINCTFIDNTANDGAALDWWGTNGTVCDILVINNTAKHDAGAILWVGNNAVVKDATIKNNYAHNDAGAIQWIGVDGTLMDAVIENNTAYMNGGAIYWVGDNDYIADLNIKSRFEEFPMGFNGMVINSSISNNTAVNDGGAIYWNGDNGIISMSTLEDNVAGCSGSAIFVNNGMTLENSVIINNKCKSIILGVYDDSPELFILVGNDNYINGIYANSDINFSNISYWNGEDVNSDSVTPIKTQKESGINITLEIYDENGTLVDNVTDLTYNGLFAYDDSLLGGGNYTFKVYHAEDSYYASTETEGKFTVEDKMEVIAPDVTKYFGGSERFVVEVLKNGEAMANKSVNITINGVTYTRTTDENGTASMGLNLNSGNYSVNVKVDNVSVNSTVSIKATAYADDLVKVFKNDTQYYALFLDGEGNPLANTNVTFNINGVFYTRTTNATGWAKLNINLPEGTYIITAINPATGERKSNNITVLSNLETSDLVKTYQNASQFVVRVLADDGSYAGADEKVTFNINGVIYNKYTDSTGYATLNINLPPGEYIITTYYKNCARSNMITVLDPVNNTLMADDKSV